MSQRTLIAAFLLGAVLGAGVTWLLASSRGPGSGGDLGRAGAGAATPDSPGALAPTDPSGAPSDPRLEPAPGAQARFTALETENADLRAKVAGLEQQVKALEPPPTDPKAFRFGVPEKAPTFDQAQWDSLADHMVKLAESLPALRDDIAADRQPSAKSLEAIQKHNMPLAVFAISLSKDLGDPMPNGAYTHPAVIANLMRAALAAAGEPLTRDQEVQIAAFGTAYVAEAERTAQTLAPTAPALARTVAEVDAKQRFLASAKGVLTASQRAILFHPQTEGRVGLDLLSPALVYGLRRPVQANNRAALEKALLVDLLGQAAVPTEDVTPYDWVARQWVDDLPGVLEPVSPTTADVVFPHVDAVQREARAQVAATERILALGRLTTEQADALRSVGVVLSPMMRTGEPPSGN